VLRQFRDFFVSLQLTVVLLALGIILIFWATLAQTDLGVWGVQQKFFHSFFVLDGLLFVNLIAAHVYRFRYSRRQIGIWLTHVGLMLLLLGELLSGLWQQDFQMSFKEGETKNYSESFRDNELAIIDSTDPKVDQVVAIPEAILARGETVQNPKLPFRVVPKAYYPNADARLRSDVAGAPPSPATVGNFAQQVVLLPMPVTYKEDERNLPGAYVELIGPDGSLGTFLLSADLPMPQHFSYGGRSYKIILRVARHYEPYSLQLLKITNDIFPGSDIPKNFASRVRLQSEDGHDNREVVIYMNNPLRYHGLTYYQYQMDKNSGTSVLQVVNNPSWRLPYVACGMMALGLVIQFGLHLAAFARRRAVSP
jgi:hypothetical protein